MTFQIKERDCELDKNVLRKAQVAAKTQQVLDARQHYRDQMFMRDALKRSDPDGKNVGMHQLAERATNHALDMWLERREEAEQMGIETHA